MTSMSDHVQSSSETRTPMNMSDHALIRDTKISGCERPSAVISLETGIAAGVSGHVRSSPETGTPTDGRDHVQPLPETETPRTMCKGVQVKRLT